MIKKKANKKKLDIYFQYKDILLQFFLLHYTSSLEMFKK